MQQCACVLQTSRRIAAHVLCDQEAWAAAQQAGLWIWLYKGIACHEYWIRNLTAEKTENHRRTGRASMPDILLLKINKAYEVHELLLPYPIHFARRIASTAPLEAAHHIYQWVQVLESSTVLLCLLMYCVPVFLAQR